MKNIVKIIIASIMIFYMSYIAVAAIINYQIKSQILDIQEIDEKYINEIKKYKQEISTLPENDCKNFMNEMIDYLEQYSRLEKEFINLENADKGFLTFFVESTERCPKFTLEDKNKYITQAATTIYGNEMIVQTITHPYEITLNNHYALLEGPQHISLARSIVLESDLDFVNGVLNVIKEVPNEE